MCDSIRKRSKACFIPFFKIDVELFMRTYIVAVFFTSVWTDKPSYVLICSVSDMP